MSVKEFVFDQGQILIPATPSPLNRLTAAAFGSSLTLLKGQAMGQKTSDGKLYALNVAATDGTQTFTGFNQISCTTDASGLVYYSFGGTAAGANLTSIGANLGTVYTGGIFRPDDLYTAATGTAVAEIDTATPAGTITASDIFIINIPASAYGPATSVQFVAVSGSVTPTNIVTGLKTAWAANPTAAAIATATGTATLVLTAVRAGVPMNLTTYCEGVGTFVNVISTAAVAAQQAEVDTFTATNPTTGDIYNLVVTFPNLTTKTISATVGATQTATAIDALLLAAWNADTPDQYGNIVTSIATPSGTATFILTAKNVGQTLSITGNVTAGGTGTIAKVVTKPALGRSINDILAGAPGARILGPNGYWQV